MTDKFEFEFNEDSRHPESVQLLLAFAKSDKIQPSLRIVAASAASKHEAQFLYSPVQVPNFANIEEAEQFLLELSQQEANRQIDVRTAATISGRIKDWIYQKRSDLELEFRRLQADVTTGDQTIRIEGGLPVLPGTNVSMPQQDYSLLNGHESLATIEHNATDTSQEASHDPQVQSTPDKPEAIPPGDNVG
jgi:hypothetical protein